MSEPGGSILPAQSSGKGGEELRPAFSSARHALWFLSLVATVLLLPEMISWSGLTDRRESYEIMTENYGAYSFVAQEIFDKSEDIDILFLGSSVLFAGVDTPQVQRALSRELGRPAKVVTFGHYFNSIDVLYKQLSDVLERRRVRMVVLSIPRMPYTDGPSTSGCRFVKYSDVKEVFQEIPTKYKAALYACGILRAPHDVLSMIRRNGSRISPSPFAENLGMDKAEIGIGRDPGAFTRFTPVSPSIPSERLILGQRTSDQFHFTNDEIPFYQNLYLEKLVELSRRKQVPLAMLNIPQHAERHSHQVIERKNWKQSFGADVPIIGVQPTILFAGLNEDELEKLRFDDAHFNANGSEFFTRAIVPGVLEIYKRNAAKSH